MNKKAVKRSERVFVFLLLLVLILGTLNLAKAKGWLVPDQSQIEVKSGNIINLTDLTLEQKIAQMVITHGGTHNLEPWRNLQLGGIHLFAMESEEAFSSVIDTFQEGMSIPFFVTADLEGCLNPLNNFYNSTPVSEIKTQGEAFQKGSDEGKYLREIGFNLNFAPVVDLDDQIWKCRSFPGTSEEIGELAAAYSLGLQKEGVIGTAKHYPGKTLVVKDPHKQLVEAGISENDLLPYGILRDKGKVKSVMVSHIIVTGEINSKGVPSVVSPDVMKKLREDYDGLIITDDTMMLGLRNFYDSVDDMYIAVWKAGADIVLNFDEDPNEMYRMILVVAEAVRSGEISEENIDASVTRILEAKGFVVH